MEQGALLRIGRLALEKCPEAFYRGKFQKIKDCVDLRSGKYDADDGEEPEHQKHDCSERAVHIRDIFKIREIDGKCI